jgi:hypothetical protein
LVKGVADEFILHAREAFVIVDDGAIAGEGVGVVVELELDVGELELSDGLAF